MKQTLLMLFGVLLSMTMGAERAAAQGPAGAGAPATAQESSHSMNPMKWVKKDSKNSTEVPGSRSDAERKLTICFGGDYKAQPNAIADTIEDSVFYWYTVPSVLNDVRKYCIDMQPGQGSRLIELPKE